MVALFILYNHSRTVLSIIIHLILPTFTYTIIIHSSIMASQDAPDLGGDAFDSMEDLGFLEVAELSLDEPEFENDLINDN
ncbi:hypothetical protein Hanom_Chr13g01200431 [Helianthus anomalus]